MADDTLEEEQVESLEDSIGKIIDDQKAALAAEDEIDESEVENEGSESSDDDVSGRVGDDSSETDQPEDESEGTEGEAGADEMAAEAETDDGEDSSLQQDGNESAENGDDSDQLEPPEDWTALQKERFANVPKDAQEFMLDSYKDFQAGFTRKTQEIAQTRRQFEAIQDALAPYEQEFTRAGLDHAGAVRQLAHWHSALRSNPREAIQALAKTYGVEFEPDQDQEIDPAFQTLRSEIGDLKNTITRQQAEARQSEQNQILAEIQAFKEATDGKGNLSHPHFDLVQDDIAALFNAGIVERGNLSVAYDKAVMLKGLAPQKIEPNPKPLPKVDDAEKVKKAKRAAAGPKSSGTVSKKQPPAFTTWEDEVRANIS